MSRGSRAMRVAVRTCKVCGAVSGSVNRFGKRCTLPDNRNTCNNCRQDAHVQTKRRKAEGPPPPPRLRLEPHPSAAFSAVLEGAGVAEAGRRLCEVLEGGEQRLSLQVHRTYGFLEKGRVFLEYEPADTLLLETAVQQYSPGALPEDLAEHLRGKLRGTSRTKPADLGYYIKDLPLHSLPGDVQRLLREIHQAIAPDDVLRFHPGRIVGVTEPLVYVVGSLGGVTKHLEERHASFYNVMLPTDFSQVLGRKRGANRCLWIFEDVCLDAATPRQGHSAPRGQRPLGGDICGADQLAEHAKLEAAKWRQPEHDSLRWVFHEKNSSAEALLQGASPAGAPVIRVVQEELGGERAHVVLGTAPHTVLVNGGCLRLSSNWATPRQLLENCLQYKAVEARQRREAFQASCKTEAALAAYEGEHVTHLSLLLAVLGAMAARHRFSTAEQNQAVVEFMTKVIADEIAALNDFLWEQTKQQAQAQAQTRGLETGLPAPPLAGTAWELDSRRFFCEVCSDECVAQRVRVWHLDQPEPLEVCLVCAVVFSQHALMESAARVQLLQNYSPADLQRQLEQWRQAVGV